MLWHYLQDLDELESDVDEVMESVSHPPESRTHHNGDVSKNMYLGGSRDGIEITTEVCRDSDRI